MSDTFKSRTKMVHGGTRRSQYNEVSEAIFLTQGFVYETAEDAQARFIQWIFKLGRANADYVTGAPIQEQVYLTSMHDGYFIHANCPSPHCNASLRQTPRAATNFPWHYIRLPRNYLRQTHRIAARLCIGMPKMPTTQMSARRF